MDMPYQIKEMFYSLQGEGAQTGRPAVFCRFAGCNLWSGREEDREKAVCQFCDTDFVGTNGKHGGRYETAWILAHFIGEIWGARSGHPYVIFTGGEPALQLDESLLQAVHDLGFEAGVETNGTVILPEGLDWICVSPKVGSKIAQTYGDELKLVYPQKSLKPAKYIDLDFRYFFIQPVDDVACPDATQQAVDYCLAHPEWHLSVQTHKFLKID
jgi:7-carboxy-7-deazaguanine synthase (Cx14CxxC type)